MRACEPVEAVVALELAVHLFNVFPGGAFRRGHVPSIESAQLPMPRGDAGSGQRSTERQQYEKGETTNLDQSILTRW